MAGRAGRIRDGCKNAQQERRQNALSGYGIPASAAGCDSQADSGFDRTDASGRKLCTRTEHFVYTVRTLEKMGVSAIIIEDKTGLKKNSLFGNEVEQTQDSIENFSAKIAAGKKAQLTDDFMIIARIESLILERGMEDALNRARAFVAAGADGIMIHSRKKSPDEILEFCDKFRAEDPKTPIVVVPSSFNSITESELAAHGVNIVIYANQLTRSAFPAMQQTAEDILRYHRAQEVDSRLMPIKDIITLIDEI